MDMLRSRASPRLRHYAVLTGSLTAAGVFLGLVGPFGSYFSGPAWQRIIYWAGLLLLGGIVFGAAAKVILEKRLSTKATAAALIAASLLLAVPFAAAVAILATNLWPQLASFGALDWYAQVVVIALPLTLAFGLGVTALERKRESRGSSLRAVSPPLGAVPQSILCLQMEDHYVRVHTAEGSRLVLATMQEAIRALGAAPGLQVHRSWWVADAAVAEVIAEGRNLRLRLTNGVIAPVARSSVAAVRAAGWL